MQLFFIHFDEFFFSSSEIESISAVGSLLIAIKWAREKNTPNVKEMLDFLDFILKYTHGRAGELGVFLRISSIFLNFYFDWVVKALYFFLLLRSRYIYPRHFVSNRCSHLWFVGRDPSNTQWHIMSVCYDLFFARNSARKKLSFSFMLFNRRTPFISVAEKINSMHRLEKIIENDPPRATMRWWNAKLNAHTRQRNIKSDFLAHFWN